jgi:hypothetical protein
LIGILKAEEQEMLFVRTNRDGPTKMAKAKNGCLSCAKSQKWLLVVCRHKQRFGCMKKKKTFCTEPATATVS